MPTPSARNRSSEHLVATPPLHNSCPPDDDRPSWRSMDADGLEDESIVDTTEMIQQPTPPPSGSLMASSTERHLPGQRESKLMDVDEEIGIAEMLSPISTGGISVEGEKQEESDIHPLSNSDMCLPSTGYDFSNIRLIPSSPSPYLRAGSKFKGNQQSERQVYDVQVEIKHVDMRESFLCGYLRIQGLTEDHPTLTTYFEGEILGTKYNFHTQHEDWGSNKKSDLQHWGKFSPFKPFKKQVEKGNFNIPNMSQRETIFMRWKEHFLVPDHRVRTISGASFEGFYYICFNQIRGTVSGIYFHAKSERFQQLELKHVEDYGCYPAVEFR